MREVERNERAQFLDVAKGRVKRIGQILTKANATIKSLEDTRDQLNTVISRDLSEQGDVTVVKNLIKKMNMALDDLEHTS